MKSLTIDFLTFGMGYRPQDVLCNSIPQFAYMLFLNSSSKGGSQVDVLQNMAESRSLGIGGAANIATFRTLQPGCLRISAIVVRVPGAPDNASRWARALGLEVWQTLHGISRFNPDACASRLVFARSTRGHFFALRFLPVPPRVTSLATRLGVPPGLRLDSEGGILREIRRFKRLPY
jgi:hypothetical protein